MPSMHSYLETKNAESGNPRLQTPCVDFKVSCTRTFEYGRAELTSKTTGHQDWDSRSNYRIYTCVISAKRHSCTRQTVISTLARMTQKGFASYPSINKNQVACFALSDINACVAMVRHPETSLRTRLCACSTGQPSQGP